MALLRRPLDVISMTKQGQVPARNHASKHQYDNEHVEAKKERPPGIPSPGNRGTHSQQQHH